MFRKGLLIFIVWVVLAGANNYSPLLPPPVEMAFGEQEVITVTGHVYLSRIGYWVVGGKTTAKGPRNFMTIYVGPDATGPVLGVVRVDRNGNWVFSELRSPIKPDSTGTISMVSQTGGILLGFPIRIR